MGSWTVIGDLPSGIPARLGWDGEKLTGTPDALAAAAALVGAGTRVPVTPTGPWIAPSTVGEVDAYVVAYNVLQRPDVTGDLPDMTELVPDLPDGAIA